MRQLLRGRRSANKGHWTAMDDWQRAHATEAVASLAGLHLVAVGSPVPLRKQERARSKCLTNLIVQLHGFEVTRLCMEARESELNRLDVRTAQHARRQLPPGAEFRVDHQPGPAEPLLWVADVVAGARRAAQLGQSAYWETLGERALDFEVATDC
jgi:hypothetical protein